MDGLHVPCFSAKRYTLYGESRKEDEMPILVFFMLLFIGMALVWVVAAGLLLGTVRGYPARWTKCLTTRESIAFATSPLCTKREVWRRLATQ